jgi:hypothetical protein
MAHDDEDEDEMEDEEDRDERRHSELVQRGCRVLYLMPV